MRGWGVVGRGDKTEVGERTGRVKIQLANYNGFWGTLGKQKLKINRNKINDQINS